MKFILMILSLVFLTTCVPKHITKQSEMTSVATICDKYFGWVTKKEIQERPDITISRNKLKWKVISFAWSTTSMGGQYATYYIIGSSLPDTVLNKINWNGRRLYIDNIKAVNKMQDTVYFNTIELQIQK